MAQAQLDTPTAYDLAARCHRVLDGRPYRLPIYNMFDIDGETTDDPELCVTAVCLLPGGLWLTTAVFDGEIVRRSDG